MGGKMTHKQMILGAVVFYSILALTTNILETTDDKRDIFRLEKLVSVITGDTLTFPPTLAHLPTLLTLHFHVT